MSIDIKNCSYPQYIKYVEKLIMNDDTFAEITKLLNEKYIDISKEIYDKNIERTELLNKIKYTQQEYKQLQVKSNQNIVDEEEIIVDFNNEMDKQVDNNDILNKDVSSKDISIKKIVDKKPKQNKKLKQDSIKKTSDIDEIVNIEQEIDLLNTINKSEDQISKPKKGITKSIVNNIIDDQEVPSETIVKSKKKVGIKKSIKDDTNVGVNAELIENPIIEPIVEPIIDSVKESTEKSKTTEKSKVTRKKK